MHLLYEHACGADPTDQGCVHTAHSRAAIDQTQRERHERCEREQCAAVLKHTEKRELARRLRLPGGRHRVISGGNRRSARKDRTSRLFFYQLSSLPILSEPAPAPAQTC